MSSVNPQKTTTDISAFSIIRAIIIILGLAFLYYIREVVALVFIAAIFAVALDPMVSKLGEWKVSRPVGLLLIYFILFALIILSVKLLIPPISEQVQNLSKALPDLLKKLPIAPAEIEKFTSWSGLKRGDVLSLSGTQKAFDILTDILGTVVGAVAFFFIILVLIYYMILRKDALKGMITLAIPKKHRKYFWELASRIQDKLNAWLIGQMLLCLIIGVLAYIGLLIAGVDYALVLALFAGITEFIPYVGPYIGAVPAIFLTYTTATPLRALFIAGWFVIIQQLENDVIVPKIMHKAVGIDPFVTIVSMMVGVKVGGIVGVILTIPVAAAISEILSDYIEHRDKKEKGE